LGWKSAPPAQAQRALEAAAVTPPRQLQLSAVDTEAEENDAPAPTATERIDAMPRPMSPLLRRSGPAEAEGEGVDDDAEDSVLPYLDPVRGETVESRQRPELDPLGIRLGSFVLHPELGIEEQYNSNIFATETDEEADFITSFTPRLLLRSDWRRHQVTLRVGADAGFYADNGSEDYVDYLAGVEGRLDITGDSYLAGSADYRHLHEDRGSPDDADGDEPTELDAALLAAAYVQRFGRINLEVAGSFEGLDFYDVDSSAGTINNDDRDRLEAEGALRVGYEFMPDVEAFVEGTYNIRDYDDAVDDAGFNRDSDGFGAAAGVTVDFGGVTFGDFYVGYRQQDYEDPAFETVSGIDAGATLTWNVTPLTTVVAGVERSIQETTTAGAAGSVATEFSVEADHELLRNLILGLDGRYMMRDYEGIDREDDYFAVGADARYMMNRNMYLSAGYEFRNRDSTLPGEDYDQHIAILRLTLRM
jgi:hypothetical protein